MPRTGETGSIGFGYDMIILAQNVNIIDTHIQLIFDELLDSDLINNESFRTVSFKTQDDFKFLKKNNANNTLSFYQMMQILMTGSFNAYGFCCSSQILNSLQNELLLDAANKFKNLHPIANKS